MVRFKTLVLAALLAFVGTAARSNAASKTSVPAAVTSSAKSALININSATKDQLMALPGVGEAYSQKIISNRPYKRKDELVKKNVIPEAVYKKIKDQIIASK